MTVTIEDIRAAAAAIRGQVVDTPCLHSRTLSEITGAEVVPQVREPPVHGLVQGARGAQQAGLARRRAAARKGVIACSAGNHAQGVAYHAARLGIPAVIVMPRYTPFVKVEHTRKHGAEVILHGDELRRGQGARAGARARARPHARASLRRREGDRGPGHHRARDAARPPAARPPPDRGGRRRPHRRHRHGGEGPEALDRGDRRADRCASRRCTTRCAARRRCSAPPPSPRASR